MNRYTNNRYSIIAATAIGAALFVYAVDRVGTEALVDGVRRVGWGIVVILLLAGARFAVRAQCWRWCLPPGLPLDFPHAFGAFLAGDAVGNVTPLGLLASEPMKVLLTRHHLATTDSVASLALENVLYGISVLGVIGGGMLLMLFSVPVPGVVRWGVVGMLAAVVVIAAAGAAVLRAPIPESRGAEALRHHVARPFRAAERVRWLRDEVARFAGRQPGRVARVLSLHLIFHALAIAETFLTLRWLLPEGPTLVQAILFESANRLTVVLFKFVPFRIGVDEAVSGALAPLLAVAASAGVTLAVVRKARLLFWAAIGLILVATHPAPEGVPGATPRQS